MGMTITEKILARHTEKGKVVPGEFIYARVDLVLGNDITAPLAIAEFRKIGVERVFDQDKVALVPDHFAPNKDIKSATQCKIMREFAQEQQISNYFEVGEMGIEHALLPEKGLVLPGDLVVGADSHTCTYGALGAFSTGVGSTDMAVAMATGELWFKVPPSMKFVLEGKLEKWVSGKDLILYIIGLIGVDGALYRAMEFTGPVIRKLSMDSRMTMANMVVEAGAESGIIEPDQLTLDYIAERAKRDYQIYKSDPDAQYWKVIEIDVTEIEPQVAFPHLPSNTRPISQVERIQIQQAVIGSCTNGRLEDLRIAAQILKGHKVAKGVRLIVIPATQDIYRQALKEGLLEIFVDSGAVISTPTCGPCLGGHMGVLAEGEKAVSTTNRNFVGRMGHPESQVYLANPAVAAASAVAGYIISPEEVEGMG
ncbi:3-isopropylmalate/(R)-2-methylmalate dehydratase large subunit [Candidatus Hakubella thermalkaliphila]|uniref:3-isopropylmalate dehydratase large subunit n=1 Tax=Candidatus Hakubella thermalkaliphila TaxID=2754717 RepID=A0A6V8NEC0_9ACTN|nr:3-isopropylmalate dehydratase large subunit [Candidatus Hakubella thermalkaliphila]MBT9170216.1 2,3-dimethylmalate dehydratase large subunit [Actinomycetota bacterium]GFP18513.1 3-isopropylmalate/(R)-2-methylmalate dehydratase large subunit [Candidatus Hakubella thermalkaliphila]GFP27058.1 3-isopropylmalate/(R)-2-methylmalate dehydratase large subunit [Candidatus Hakubella thermalkaliphila]GFP36396.1 3-isopropylmalate/(R)-2-methylmalate dehydratase large subunit [Candidatus Hakubella thermal